MKPTLNFGDLTQTRERANKRYVSLATASHDASVLAEAVEALLQDIEVLMRNKGKDATLRAPAEGVDLEEVLRRAERLRTADLGAPSTPVWIEMLDQLDAAPALVRALMAERAERADMVAKQQAALDELRSERNVARAALEEDLSEAFAVYRQATTSALGIDPSSCAEDVQEAIRELKLTIAADAASETP